MPIFGNPVQGPGGGYLTPTDLNGHFDPVTMGGWGNPIPACVVSSIQVYGDGPPMGQPDAVSQFGIYDASSGVPATYTLVATSPTWVAVMGIMPKWWVIPCSIPLLAGTYALSILSNSAGAFTQGVYFVVKAVRAAVRTFITAGVFPDPLGICSNTNQDFSMYATYSLAAGAPNTPPAACCCQPKCGEG